jgi:hypothetical protein
VLKLKKSQGEITIRVVKRVKIIFWKIFLPLFILKNLRFCIINKIKKLGTKTIETVRVSGIRARRNPI